MFILTWWSLESDIIILEALFHLRLLFSLAGIHLSSQVTQSWKEVQWQSWLFSPVYVTISLPLASIGWTKLAAFGGLRWISLYLSSLYYVCFSSHYQFFNAMSVSAQWWLCGA